MQSGTNELKPFIIGHKVISIAQIEIVTSHRQVPDQSDTTISARFVWPRVRLRVIEFARLVNLEDNRVMTPSRAAMLTTWPSPKFGPLADESEPMLR